MVGMLCSRRVSPLSGPVIMVNYDISMLSITSTNATTITYLQKISREVCLYRIGSRRIGLVKQVIT